VLFRPWSGAPDDREPERLHHRRVGTSFFNVPANLNVASGIENFGTISIDATGFGPGAVTINVTGGVLQNNGRVVAPSKDFGASGSDGPIVLRGAIARPVTSGTGPNSRRA
jgi:hypothetical protein